MVSARPSQRRSSGSPLTVKKILAWADAHHRRTGHWPTINSGEIPGANGDTWSRVYCALYQGLRGLPGGSSLSKLLAEHRGVRNRMRLPRLTKKQILAWADAHQKKKGRWPTRASGAVLGNEDESWKWINQALVRGQRGLPGGDTLASLLKKRRGAQPKRNTRSLSVAKILTWADAHYRRYKQWPNLKCDRVTRTDGETWPNLNAALEQGLRGLPGGSSLAKLLAEHRGVRNRHTAPPLTMEQILDWADQHRASTGEWPKESSGQVSAAPDETWNAISASLQRGMRGLPGDSSLSKLLQAHRGYRNPSDPPRLTEKLILAWADAHTSEPDDGPRSPRVPLKGNLPRHGDE